MKHYQKYPQQLLTQNQYFELAKEDQGLFLQCGQMMHVEQFSVSCYDQ